MCLVYDGNINPISIEGQTLEFSLHVTLSLSSLKDNYSFETWMKKTIGVEQNVTSPYNYHLVQKRVTNEESIAEQHVLFGSTCGKSYTLLGHDRKNVVPGNADQGYCPVQCTEK